MVLDDGFTATGTGMTARSAWSAPTSAATLQCARASLRNNNTVPPCPPTACKSIRTCCCCGFTATGSSEAGALRLVDAHIGNLNCTGAELRNDDSGPALSAASLQVDRDMVLTTGSPPTPEAVAWRLT